MSRTKSIYDSYNSISEALNLPPIDFDIDESYTNVIPFEREPLPAWNRGFNQFGSKENHPLYGKEHSVETKIKICKASIGRKASIETRSKMSKSHIGRPSANGMLGKTHSDETKAKMSKSAKGFSEEARRKQKEHMTGKKLSDETRAKMRESHLKRNAENRVKTSFL
jgi:hypothetical protein